MAVLLKIKNYLLLLVVCSLLIYVGSTFGNSEDSSITYQFRIVQVSDTQPPPGQQCRWDEMPEIVRTVNSLNPDFVIFPAAACSNKISITFPAALV